MLRKKKYFFTMSGVFIVLWDEKYDDRCEVLLPTKGGWPHITVAYTGRKLSLYQNSKKKL